MSDHPPPSPSYLVVPSPAATPAQPPLVAIPMSVVIYEGMRMAPSLVCLAIVGLLIHSKAIPAEMGVMGLLAILAGQLYPKQQDRGK